VAKEWRHYTCLVGSNTWADKNLSCFYLTFVFFFLDLFAFIFSLCWLLLCVLPLIGIVTICSCLFQIFFFHCVPCFVWALLHCGVCGGFSRFLCSSPWVCGGASYSWCPHCVVMVFNYLWHSSCSWWCLTIHITLDHSVFLCFIVVSMV
jgi:hypothetical protein